VKIWSQTRLMGELSSTRRTSQTIQLSDALAVVERRKCEWSARPGSNRRPSAWECDWSRVTALVFAPGVEIEVLKGS
jgi:hypothetical protein